MLGYSKVHGVLVDEDNDERPWYWRNCRSLSISLAFTPFPWEWHIRAEEHDQDHMDYLGWGYSLQFGPITLIADASIGNSSSEVPWRARFGLSEQEAWNRADDYFQARLYRRGARKKS